MQNGVRTYGKWGLRGVLFLFALAVLYVVTLAFPYPLFAHQGEFGEFTVHSTQPLPVDMGQTIEEARVRVAAMENARPGARCHVFICGDQPLYSFFTSLTRLSPDSMAMGLSVFGNVFLNAENIQRVGEQNTWGIRHSRFEGNYAEAIAHEIAHFNIAKQMGFTATKRLPVWKSEGYAEYQANLATTRADPSYIFSDRIDLLLNAPWGEGSVTRTLFEWHLLVEFLSEVKGYSLEDLMDVNITEAYSKSEMINWYAAQQPAS